MKKPKKKIKEQDLKKLVVEYLNRQGHYVWPTNAGMAFFYDKNGRRSVFRSGFKGLADVVGMINGGKFLAIELKVGYNKPSDDQKAFLWKVNEMGGVAFVAYSLEEVIQIMGDTW